MKRYLVSINILLFLFFYKAQAQNSQVVSNGTATNAITFPVNGCVYNWTNDQPGIGLAASGTGDIPSFIAVNTGSTPIKANIAITPGPQVFAYIANLGSNTVWAVNTATGAVIAKIGVGTNPTGVAVSPDGTLVYVTNNKSNDLSVISTASNTEVVVPRVKVGLGPVGVAVSPDGKSIYVANSLSDNVAVIDAITYSVKFITVGLSPQGIVFSPDGSKVYVANQKSNTVSVITTATGIVSTINVGTSPFGMAVSPDGSKVYVTNTNSKSVSVINTLTNAVSTVTVGTGPAGVAVSPDGSKVYVANEISNTLSVIDAASNTVSATVTVDNLPFGVSVSPDGNSVFVTDYLTNNVCVVSPSSNSVVNRTNVGSNPTSLGNFLASSICNSAPYLYTITVTPQLPVIITGPVSGKISACAGSASAGINLQEFTVSATNLTANVTASAPPGFEVSLNATSSFGANVSIPQTSGTINNVIVYVRSSSSAPAGTLNENVSLTSPGSTAQNVPVSATVHALPTVNPVGNQSVPSGATVTIPGFTGTANTFIWTNNTPSIGLAASGSGDIASFTAVNTGSTPITATVTVTPVSAPYAYMACNNSNTTVSVVNTITNNVVASVPVVSNPYGVAVSPDGTLVYVTNNTPDGNVSVISTATNKVVATIPAGPEPTGIAISPDGKRLYVSNYPSSITVINTTTYATTNFPADNPLGLALSPDGSRLYAVNPASGTVTVYNTTGNTQVAVITVGLGPTSVAVSPDGSWAYVTVQNSNYISVINTTSNTVAGTIPGVSSPVCLTLNGDGSLMYVSCMGSNSVAVINTGKQSVIATIPVASTPKGISITPDGSTVVVANFDSSSATLISTTTNGIIATVPVSISPISLGNFIAGGTGCSGAPIKFTITVAPAPPTINASAVTGNISACQGNPSASPQILQFTVTGTNLNGDITATAPAGFEMSLSPTSGYVQSGVILTQTGSGTTNSIVVYVRASATAPTGGINGSVTLTSPGATTVQVPIAGSVTALPTVNQPPNQSVPVGTTVAAVKFTGTGNNIYNWTNDTPAIGLAASGTGDIAAFTSTNPGATPLKATVTVTPVPAGYAYITNANTKAVDVINTATNKVVTSVPVGSLPYGVAISPDQSKVYVSNSAGNSVSVINTATNTIAATINGLGNGDILYGVAVSPDGSTVYVVGLQNNVYVINTATNTVSSFSCVPGFGVVVSADGSKLYITGFSSSNVVVVSTATQTVLATINVGTTPKGLTFSPDGSRLYVANSGGNTVSVINTSSNSIAATITVGQSPASIVTSADGSKVYVTNGGDNTVSVIDAATNLAVASIPVGTLPYGISITADGSLLYVTNQNSNNVSVVSTASNSLVANVPIGGTPTSFGTFVTRPADCPGIPKSFFITVNPGPTITASAAVGHISACAGSPSASPQIQQFTVSGTTLTADIVVKAPPGFELSLSTNTGYGNSLTLPQVAGTVNNTTIYVRAAASASTGDINGSVVLTSAGATTQDIAVRGTINALPTVNPLGPITVGNGQPTPAINFTGPTNIFNWNNDTPSIGLPANGTGNIASFIAQNPGSTNVVATVTVTPVSTGYAYIPNEGSGDVSVISTGTGRVIAKIPVGTNPIGVSVSPDGSKAYVVNNGSNSVSVINTATNTVSTPIPVQSFPVGIAVSPDGNFAYVANETSNSVSVINTGSNTVSANIQLAANSSVYGIAVSPDGKTVYVTGIAANTLSVIDVPSKTVSAVIQVGQYPVGVLVGHNGSKIYVSNQDSQNISVIDASTNRVTTTLNTGTSPTGLALSLDGTLLYVANSNSNNISVFNTGGNALVSTFSAGTLPYGISVSPDGNTLYAANEKSNDVYAISTVTGAILQKIAVETSPYSFGNFLTQNVTCDGDPVPFTITVKPTIPGTIIAGPVTGTITACAGSPSESPNIQQFTVSGSNLTGDITATAPNGFEVSLIATSGYGGTVILPQSAGTVSNVVVYVRSAISATGPISGNVVLSSPGTTSHNVGVSGMVNPLPVVNPVPPQTAMNGQPTHTITFTGTANNFNWTNDTPSIGLAATGSGDIRSFTAINTGTTNVVANVVVTPVSSVGCSGTPVPFTITVASSPPPVITVGTASGSISACVGSASTIPDIEQFTVSGANLTGNITATASNNFEISLSAGSGYTGTLTFTPPAGGTIVYVRSAVTAPAGSISNKITLSSTGAATKNVTVSGTINALPVAAAIPNQEKINGMLTNAVNFTGTGNSYTWTNSLPSIGLNAAGNGDIPSFTAINTGATPVVATIVATPTSNEYAYIANSISNNVTVINVLTGGIVTTIGVDNNPTSVSVSPDGTKAYVTNQRSNSISIINTSTNIVTGKLTNAGASPTAVTVSPDGKLLYVLNLNSNDITVLSATDYSTVASIGVGGYPVNVALTPDGKKLYATNSSNSITVIDAVGHTVITSIPESSSPNGIAITPDGTKVYAAITGTNMVSVISTSSNQILTSIAVGSNPAGVAVSPDGRKVYVTNSSSNDVTVISTATDAVLTQIPVGTYPQGISVTPDGSEVYVVNEKSDNVSVINSASNTVGPPIGVGSFPISMGNFITNGTGCTGTPIQFTITVDPTPPPPVITASGVLSGLTTIYGSPSPSESFTISATGLTAGVLVTPPTGFEVSTDNVNFSSTVTMGTTGTLAATPVFIRLAAITPVGSAYGGNINLTSAGAELVTEIVPTSTVTPAPLTIIADDKTKILDMPDPVLTATYVGFVNNETPAVLTSPAILSTTAVTTSPVGQYPISVTGAASPNYTINPLSGTLTILTEGQAIVIPNTFTPNGDGINDTWNIKFLDTYSNCTVDIFNRWGQKVFTSIGYGIPWDGTYRGSALPAGTYYYLIDLKRGLKILSGYVAVIR